MPTGNELVKLSDLGTAFNIKLDKDFSGLTAANTFSSTDIIPIAVTVNNVTTTYKLTGATLAAALAGIGNYLTTDDLPLAVNKGGSGLTASPSILIDLAASAAVNVMQASPRPGVTGILGLANGGLGVDFSSAGLAGFHNSIKRGKYLGNSFTTAQSTAITSGLFTDMFVGDYWTINGVDWVIVDFDPYYQCGDTISLGHHIAVVPRARLYNAQWNTSNDTSVGYIGSAIRAGIKASGGAEEKVIAAFGSDHVLVYQALYPSAYSSGKATGQVWTDARVELLNETEVYGHQVWTGGGNCNGYEDGINKRQLALFALDPTFMNIHVSWWLRSVDSATSACIVRSVGYASYDSASSSTGVRPLSLIA